MRTLLLVLGILVSIITNARSLGEAKILLKESRTNVETVNPENDGFVYLTEGNKLIVTKKDASLKSAKAITYSIEDELLMDCFNSGCYKKCNFPGITLEKDGNAICFVCDGQRFSDVDKYVFEVEGSRLQAFIEYLDKISPKGLF